MLLLLIFDVIELLLLEHVFNAEKSVGGDDKII